MSKLIEFPGSKDRDETFGPLESSGGKSIKNAEKNNLTTIRPTEYSKNSAEESKELVRLGLDLLSQRRLLEARVFLKKATEVDKTNADAFYNLATTYAESDFGVAETNFMHALLLNPEWVEIYLSLGSMYHQFDLLKSCLFLRLFLEKTQNMDLDENAKQNRLTANMLLSFVYDKYPDLKK